MALPFSPNRDPDPALPTAPVSPPPVARHAHLPSDGRDGLAPTPSPHPAPGAASPTSTTPDPAATCGMPDRPLSPPSSSASSAVSTRPSPPRDAALRGGARGEALPLADRCWDLFCQGHSFAAIGRTLGIHRETAARHVKAIHQQVQADRRADRALALSRALATQERIQATAWTLLAHAQVQATPQEETPPSSPPSSSASSASSAVLSRVSSLANCARLLTLILASAREAARLDLLYDRDAPARKADQDDKPKAIRLIIERVGDPYVDPTQLTQSPTSADSSSRREVVPSPASSTPAPADPSTVSAAAGSPPPEGERPVSLTTPLAQPADDPGLGAPRPNLLYGDPRPLSRPGPLPPAAGVASADP